MISKHRGYLFCAAFFNREWLRSRNLIRLSRSWFEGETLKCRSFRPWQDTNPEPEGYHKVTKVSRWCFPPPSPPLSKVKSYEFWNRSLSLHIVCAKSTTCPLGDELQTGNLTIDFLDQKGPYVSLKHFQHW